MDDTEFYIKVDELDEIINLSPSEERIESFYRLVQNETLYRYAFEHLNQPSWINPLYKKGFFKKPPEPIVDEEGGTITIQYWPESKYLSRMAHHEPEKVLDIILHIPESNNIRIHNDFIEAALMMEPVQAVKWAEAEAEWILSQNKLDILYPEEIGKVIIMLANEGYFDISLRLMNNLLSFKKPEKESDSRDLIRIYQPPIKPRARIGQWEYEQFLEKYVPLLFKINNKQLFISLCKRLNEAIYASLTTDEKNGEEDFSDIWRPSIEESRQKPHRGFRNLLVTRIRDFSDLIMEKDGLWLFETFEAFSYPIFKRLELYLRNKWLDVDSKGTELVLLDQAYFDNRTIHHEYYSLLHTYFNKLDDGKKDQYYAMIKEPNDIDEWIIYIERKIGERPKDDEIQRFIDQWTYTKLYPIQDYLDDAWKTKYNQLQDEFGELEHPDFLIYMGEIQVGPKSPRNLDEMRIMDIDELLSYLKDWEPSPALLEPSSRGLATTLSTIVTSKPDIFTIEYTNYIELNPIYIQAIISGFHDAVKLGEHISWDSVLDLCSQILENSYSDSSDEKEIDNPNSYWTITRWNIADLLSVGFENSDDPIPYQLRTKAWKILDRLIQDDDPTPEFERKYGGSNMDPATLSINTTRGKTMHAIIRYALWIRKNVLDAERESDHAFSGFRSMPEVLNVLEEHLIPTNDPSIAVRSVYGQWLPWIALIDMEWVEKNVTKIFPTTDDHSNIRESAWETYITFCQPYDSLFTVLERNYSIAIITLNNPEILRNNSKEYETNLIEHLFTFYWRGKINLDAADNLLTNYYNNSNDNLNKNAIEFIGRSLYNTQEDIPNDIITRLKFLWNVRFESVRESSKYYELLPFGWWFCSDKFPIEWSLEHLKAVFSTCGNVEPTIFVFNKLAILMKEYPNLVLECLNLFIINNTELWQISTIQDNIRAILVIGIQSDDYIIRKITKDIVNRLGAHGFLEYRDIIK